MHGRGRCWRGAIAARRVGQLKGQRGRAKQRERKLAIRDAIAAPQLIERVQRLVEVRGGGRSVARLRAEPRGIHDK